MCPLNTNCDYYRQAIQDLRLWRKRVGDTIRNLRTEREITLDDLGDMTGIRADRIDLYEQGGGYIDPQQIARIAAALGVGFMELM